MPRFTYIARSKTGQRVEGAVEANDRRSALLQIEHLGHVPVSVAEGGAVLGKKPTDPKQPAVKKSFKIEWRRNARPRMALRDTLLLTRELSDLLSSGMTLGNALHTLSKRRTTPAQDTIVAALRDDIIQGSNLSEALGKWPETFSPLYVSMVRAGEVSGQLQQVLGGLVHHFERVLDAREKVMTALIYPAIILSVGAVTIIFSMVFVVPRFSAIFKELGSTLPLPTRILIGTSAAMLHYGWLILILMFVGGILLRRWLRTTEGKRHWHRLQLRIPVVKNIITANAFGHFARTLGALMANGVPVLQALSIVEDTAGNVIIAEAIRDARNKVTDGSSISGPLAAGKVFPPLLTDMLAVGEQSGNPGTALEHIARRYDNDLDRSVKIFTTVLEPLLMLFMAVLVGFVAISMLMAVFDMTNGLNAQ